MRELCRSRMAGTLVAALVVTACTSSSQESAPTTTVDDEAGAPPTTSDTAFDSYDDLIEAAANDDPAAVARVTLAEVAADLGPIEGAPVIDAALIGRENGHDALTRLQSSGPMLSAEQRDAVERWWNELTSDDAVVYRSADDTEYEQTRLAAIESGLPEVVDPDLAEAEAATLTAAGSEAVDQNQTLDAEPEGLLSRSGHEPRGLVGVTQPVPRQVDEVGALATARTALLSLTARLGGTAVNMEVFVVPARTPRLRPDEYARSTTTVEQSFFDPPTSVEELDVDRSIRPCTVLVKDSPVLAADESFYRSVVAHEVFHCWQRANAFSFLRSVNLPPYYFEGSAMWAGEQFAQGSEYGLQAIGAFFAQSEYSTADSPIDGYDGFGFWTQVAQLRGGPAELWRRLPAINAVADRGGQVTFSVATAGIETERLAQLASSAARQSTWGSDWDLTGVSVGDGTRAITSFGVGEQARADKRGQRLVEYSIAEAELRGDGPWWIIDLTTEGLVNAHWESGDTFVITTPASRQFCTDGRCECPPGTERGPAGEPVPGDSESIQLALTGTAAEGASVVITATPTDEACTEPTYAAVVADKYTTFEEFEGEGLIRLVVGVGADPLRVGDALVGGAGGPATSVTVQRILVGFGRNETSVDSLDPGEFGVILVSAALDDFEFDQQLVRP